MAGEPLVLERGQPRKQHAPRLGLVARERQGALEDIARRQHAELVAQHARAAAAVEHGDDRVQPEPGIALQTAEKTGESGAAPEAGDLDLSELHSRHIVDAAGTKGSGARTVSFLADVALVACRRRLAGGQPARQRSGRPVRRAPRISRRLWTLGRSRSLRPAGGRGFWCGAFESRVRSPTRMRRSIPSRSVAHLEFADLAGCADREREVGARRPRHAAAPDPRRVRLVARRLPDRVRRHHRSPRRARRRRSVRRRARPRRGPAPGLRSAGAQPPDSPARGISRDGRRAGRGRAADSALDERLCARC